MKKYLELMLKYRDVAYRTGPLSEESATIRNAARKMNPLAKWKSASWRKFGMYID